MNKGETLGLLRMAYEQQRQELRRAVSSFYVSSGLLVLVGMLIYMDLFSTYRDKAFIGFFLLILIWFAYSVHYHFERRQIRFSLLLYERLINALAGAELLFVESGFYRVISDLELDTGKQQYGTGQTVRLIHKFLAVFFFLYAVVGAASLLGEKDVLLIVIVLVFLGYGATWTIRLIRKQEKRVDAFNEQLIKDIERSFEAGVQ
jgi:Flp pilus assembly protein TadB